MDSTVVDWRPGSSAAAVWTVVGVAVTIVGIPLFASPSLIRAGSAGRAFGVGIVEIFLLVALTVVLVIAHEAIHGLVMLGFGARPRFGAMLVGRVIPAFFATAEGHHFTRHQYLIVAAAPAVTISALGFWACFGIGRAT